MSEPETDIERLSIDTTRVLAADIVEKANSGHPGLPMALAPLAFLLYSEVMNHDPADPAWPDRDRFVLSPGHGSALLYSALHLSGYDLPLSELEAFRQWGSRTPGHPEYDPAHPTPGVETTTGPLGQGFGNGVGFAIAERWLRGHFGEEICDHRTWGIVSDGDLMEGISAEAASLAGHLGLGRLTYIWDDNKITLDGPSSLSFEGEDVLARFEAYGWQTIDAGAVDDLDRVRAAIAEAISDESRPTLIRVSSIIGWPAPHKQNSSAAHGAPLGDEELRAVKEKLGFDPDQSFVIPDGVRECWAGDRKGATARAAWESRLASFLAADEQKAALWRASQEGRFMPGLGEALPVWDPAETAAVATRSAGGKALVAVAEHAPTMIGGSADLVSSTKASVPGGGDMTRSEDGRNIHFGVREHAMGAIVNGLDLHGGIVRPFGSTFLQFADYMRGAIRLASLMRLNVAWVFTHDSVALGEDGPTHQPVEHIAALRAIPGLTVIRPSDANETSEAWRVTAEEVEGPVALILSRQDLPVIDRAKFAPAAALGGGAYVLSDSESPVGVIVATGSEVHTALAAQDLLAGEGVATRVVAMPSWELFEARSVEERETVLPANLPTVSVEAGVSMGWDRWADAHVAIDHFGASAPGDELLERFGITAEAVAEKLRGLLAS
ncbi:MAG: transketolase [Solirubrobacterales bacterium]|nr:transketolase [Solirubrobacterales bacterium]